VHLEVLKQLQTQGSPPSIIQAVLDLKDLINASIQGLQQQQLQLQQDSEDEKEDGPEEIGQQQQGHGQKKTEEQKALEHYLGIFKRDRQNPGLQNRFRMMKGYIQKLQPVLLQPPENEATAQERWDFMQVRSVNNALL
jgi:hypothetical protein